MKIIQGISIFILSVFLCIFYPDYLLLEELCHYVDREQSSSVEMKGMRDWEGITEIESEDIIISSKICQFIREKRKIFF